MCGAMAIGVPLGRVLQHTMCVRVGHVWSVRRGMCSERFPVWSRYGGGQRSGAGGAWKSDGCDVGAYGAGKSTRRAGQEQGGCRGNHPSAAVARDRPKVRNCLVFHNSTV